MHFQAYTTENWHYILANLYNHQITAVWCFLEQVKSNEIFTDKIN